MTIQSDLFSLLGTTFSGRLYPLAAPTNATRPFGVYQRISTVPATIHGVGQLSETRMQVDCYAETYAAAITLANQVATVVAAAANLVSVPLIQADDYEAETKLYRVMLEFTFWH